MPRLLESDLDRLIREHVEMVWRVHATIIGEKPETSLSGPEPQVQKRLRRWKIEQRSFSQNDSYGSRMSSHTLQPLDPERLDNQFCFEAHSPLSTLCFDQNH